MSFVNRDRAGTLFGWLAVLVSVIYLAEYGKNDLVLWLMMILFGRLGLVLTVICFFMAALFLGKWISRISFFNINTRMLPKNMISLGIGLWAVSWIILIAGSCGLIHKHAYLWIVLVVGGWELFCQAKAFTQNRLWSLDITIQPKNALIFGVLVFMGGLIIWGAFLPPLTYDGLEYHVGAPMQYIRDGRIHFLEENVYASFPALVEMFYLWGLVSVDMLAPKLIHAALGLMSLYLIFVIGRDFFSRTAGWLGALFFAVYPGLFLLTTQVYIDLGVLFFGLLTVLVMFQWCKNPGQAKKFSSAIGFFVGCACACKYTAVLLWLLPVWILLNVILKMKKMSLKEYVFHNGCFFVMALLAVMPWLIKNTVFSGNPVFPFLYEWLGGRGWTQELSDLFMTSHLPLKFDLNVLKETWIRNHQLNVLLIVFIPGLILEWKEKNLFSMITGLLVLMMLVLFHLWTKSLWRFFIIGAGLMALLSARGLCLMFKYLKNRVVRVGLVLVICAGVLYGVVLNIVFLISQEALGVIFGVESPKTYLSRRLPHYPAVEYLNRLELNRSKEKILFVGESRIFYIEQPIISGTAFNKNVLEEIFRTGINYRDIYEDLRARHISYIFINFSEVSRLEKSYGYLKDFDWGRFYGFSDEYLDVVFQDEKKTMLVYRMKK
ncbi:glycosyltransferase family 39 protein [PVC group bacterium]|nr:glycosyltransferase family 39 protein [PVC group bacterium]